MKILLLHGDTLCTDDLDYQNLGYGKIRKWQNEMLSKPLSERLMIAEALEEKQKQIWKRVKR